MKLHHVKTKDDLGVKFNLWEKDIIDRYPRLDEANRQTGGRYAYLDRDDRGLQEIFVPLDRLGPRGALEGTIERQGHATLLDFGRTTGNQLFALLNHSHFNYRSGTDIDHIKADIVTDEDLLHLGGRWLARALMLGGVINYEVVDDLELAGSDGSIPPTSYDLITAFDALAESDSADAVLRGLAGALRPEGMLYFNMVEGREDMVSGAVVDLRDAGYDVITLAEQEPLEACHAPHWPEEWDLPVPYRVMAPAA